MTPQTWTTPILMSLSSTSLSEGGKNVSLNEGIATNNQGNYDPSGNIPG